MSTTIDQELSRLLELGEQIVKRATDGGATVAECTLRSGAELSAKVRLGRRSWSKRRATAPRGSVS